ncbi:hypothetical protein ACQCVO_14850 [Bacillus infantis]|uniref:hypothetical protein n=1 Tax=Bacillus infantis TaxID=324767 RepID=UPI003CFB6236
MAQQYDETNKNSETTGTTAGVSVPGSSDSSGISPDSPAMKSEYSSSSSHYGSTTNDNSKLLKGIVLGGIVGGALALLDTSTRNKVMGTATDLKDSSVKMFNEVKENPGEAKDNMISQFKSASSTLKEAISDAQKLYERVNNDVFGKVNEFKGMSGDAKSNFQDAKSGLMDAKDDLMDIGSKVKDAGSELVETPVGGSGSSDSSSSSNSSDSSSSSSNSSSNNSTNSSKSNTSSTGSNGTTAFSSDSSKSTATATPSTQKNSKNR